MFEQLKKIYPSIIRFTNEELHISSEYIWFTNDKNDVFGILKSELTKKDLHLLSTFLTRYNHFLPPKTTEEEIWYKRIRENVEDTARSPYRFVYFSLQKGQAEPALFKEAISQLFNKQVPILWENETCGIIIEEIVPTEEEINYRQIIDILMNDLSVNIKFYIGDMKHNFEKLADYYDSLLEVGEQIFELTNKTVMNYVQSIPYFLLHQLDERAKSRLSDSILKSFDHDEEMIKTLEMFLQSNLNVSETAKKLYMHRNSLQYRIDKFCAETGINIQQFDEAVAVKLALLIKKMKE